MHLSYDIQFKFIDSLIESITNTDDITRYHSEPTETTYYRCG
jgi:hypothetical protein